MFGLCQIEPRAGRLFAMTWIVLGVVLIGVLVMFRYPLFMPNLRKDMTREEIARELQNMRNLRCWCSTRRSVWAATRTSGVMSPELRRRLWRKCAPACAGPAWGS